MPEDSPSSYENIVLRGFDINANFQYTFGYIPAKSWSEYQGLVNVYAIYPDQSRELILKDQNIEADIDFMIPPNTQEVVLESSDDSFLVKRKYYHELTIYLFLKRKSKRFNIVGLPSNQEVSTPNLH